MYRGFTLVELLIVISVIVTLTAISIASFDAVQKQAQDDATKSLASIVKVGVEKYHLTNNEYPLPTTLTGQPGDITGPPPSYSTAASVLGTTTAALSSKDASLVTCDSVCFSPLNKKYVYYVTKRIYNDNNTFVFSVPNCSFSLTSPMMGGTNHLIFFWSNDKNDWQTVRSDKGDAPATSGTSCGLRVL